MKLQSYATQPVFENLAIGRGWSDPVEVQERVLNQLVNGVCVFAFHKVDSDEVRLAIGTLNANLIPDVKEKQAHLSLVQLCKSITDLYEEVAAPDRKREFLKRVTFYVDGIKEIISKMPEQKLRKLSDTSQPFFDLQAMAWKAYRKENVLTVLEF